MGISWVSCISVSKAAVRGERTNDRELIMISCVGQGREWEGDPNPECLFGGTSALLVVN